VPRIRRDPGLALGFRSGLEEKIAEELRDNGITVSFESMVIPFVQPMKPRKYTPDFPLPNGIILETKGQLVNGDRQKHILVKAQHPDLDIRFVFSNARQRISKQSRTTYGDWCEKYGFQYAHRHVPIEWLREAPNKASLAVIKSFTKKQKGA